MAKAKDFQIVTGSWYDYRSLTYPDLTCTYFSHLIFFLFPISQLPAEWATHFSSNDYFSFFLTAIFWPFIPLNSFADQEHSGTIFLRFIVF